MEIKTNFIARTLSLHRSDFHKNDPIKYLARFDMCPNTQYFEFEHLLNAKFWEDTGKWTD